MRKANIPLILGSLILFVIVLTMIFPGLFTDNSPYTIQLMRFTYENGELSAERAPFPPDDDFLMGSDDLGRDIFSYIVYGTRLTISLGLLIAAGQFLIAIPLALLGGFGNRMAKSIIMQFNVIFSAIPALLISIILLKLDFIAGLDKQNSILAFIFILTAVSWPKLGSLILERVESILGQPFIKGEIAIGKKRFDIALENVLPHLAPELIILFFMEVARNLSMIMQLGIFAIFVGNLGIINDQQSGIMINTDISFEPEWASMLSTSRTLIGTSPWAVIFPALAFFISVLGFNMFGEGLRNAIQRKNSRMTLVLRKLISFDISYLWRMVEKKEKIKYAVAFIAIVSAFILIKIRSGDDYSINIDQNMLNPPNQIIIGTDEAKEATDQITEKMINLGIEPLNDGSFVMSYDIGSSYTLIDQAFSIKTSDGRIELRPNNDFSFISSSNNYIEGRIYDASKDDMFNIDEYERFEDKFILIDKAYYNEQALSYFVDRIKEQVDIKGVLLIARKGETVKNLIIDESKDIPIILVSKEASSQLTVNPDIEISVSSSAVPLGKTGNNIIGIYKGTDKNIGDEAIAVGFGYNYESESGNEVLRFDLELMERLCQQSSNKRSIIFMFLDGTIDENLHGIRYVTQSFPYSPNKVQGYIDLTGLVESRFDHIEFSSAQAPVTRPLAWALGHHLEEVFTNENIELRELETISIDNEYYFTKSDSDNVMFWDRGIPTIIINTPEQGLKNHSIEELGSILLEVINKSNY